jgi:PAS domain S-box-containing protein
LSNTIVESAIVKEELIREQYLMDALMNTITDNIYFKDRESRFIRINKSLTSWFGIDDPKEAIGKTDFDFFSDEHAKLAYEGEQKILQTRKPLKGIEEKETWPDGHETWVSTTKAPLFDGKGNISGTFGISRDITDRKQIEEAFKKAKVELDKKAKELAISNEALTKSNEELEQFAYVASHDLQEPLRMVSSYLGLVGRRYTDKLDKDGKEFIEYAVDGAKRMQAMINDLLQYSRVTTQGKPFEKTNMEEVLEKVLMNLKIAIEESGGKITHDKLPEIMADRVQMERLLQNLLGNAIKYRGDRKPKVHVSVKRKKGEYEFSVQDNGIGIEKEYQGKIFGIFQRLHTREEYAGTGIGLAVCKKIVERHKGKIWVDGKINEGSSFYLTIPC